MEVVKIIQPPKSILLKLPGKTKISSKTLAILNIVSVNKRITMLKVSQNIQKLVIVLVTFILTTNKKIEKLEYELYIQYSIIFKDMTKALLDLRSKNNVINQAFAHQLGLKTQTTNIGAQKINNTTLKTYKIIILTFFISNKDSRKKFFKDSFLLADIKSDVVLKMLFLVINNVDIDF